MKCKHEWEERFNKEQDYSTYRKEYEESHHGEVSKVHEVTKTGKQTILILICTKCGEIDKTTTPDNDRRW